MPVSRVDRAATFAAHAARVLASAALRTAAYLGPLLVAAAIYLWRTAADAASAAQSPVRAWYARRSPERAGGYDAWRAAAHERRRARWAPWSAVPSSRRLEIRAAALALVILSLAAYRWSSRADGVVENVEADEAYSSPVADAEAPANPPPNEARTASPEAFLRDIQSAPAKKWVVLKPPVLAPNARGTWDDFRVGSPVVVKDGATGSSRGASGMRFRMWFAGCRLARLEYDCGIGHATSSDGVVWQRAPAPVLSPKLPKPFWVNAVAVVPDANGYSMWYSVNSHPFGDDQDRRLATIRLASSPDGLTWQDQGIVLSARTEATRMINHAVHHDGRALHLWYVDLAGQADSDSESSGPMLLHHTSQDGRTWSRAGADDLDGLASRIGRVWISGPSTRGFRALVVDQGESPVLRWLTSRDGSAWTAGDTEPDLPVMSDNAILVDPVAIEEPDGLWLWTTMMSRHRATDSIGVAFRKGGSS
jgi:hypothetical protein